GRTARGTAIVNLLQLSPGEKVTTMLPFPAEKSEGTYLVMATRKGTIKRTELSEFMNLRRAGLIAIVLRDDDELIGVRRTEGDSDILVGTRDGMSIRFHESDMRPMGRSAMGVRSIDLDEDDEVIDVAFVEEGAQVLSITENGYGKRTDIDEYRLQQRGGKGIKAMNLTEKTGNLAAQLLVHDDEDLLLITSDGTVIRTPVNSISVLGRNTQGVRLMRVGEDSKVVCVARAEPEPEEEPENDVETEATEATETGSDLDMNIEEAPAEPDEEI
ncbi:MAG: DNA gyrase C-terminal beta-propeller domain-containing protein, partial [Aristaeellaceae bacterium]